jgi:hypothetical protein
VSHYIVECFSVDSNTAKLLCGMWLGVCLELCLNVLKVGEVSYWNLFGSPLVRLGYYVSFGKGPDSSTRLFLKYWTLPHV